MMKKLKQGFYGFLCFLMSFQQIYPTYAQIAVDTGAPAINQAGLATAPNGTDIINIVNPNASGLSHNKFTDYNVGTGGVILNNSAVVGASSLGGAIIGNPNLTSGNEANVILNEVTSTNPSVLEGATEVFGASADVIVANPNGITCRGCDFINTPNATLTTGTPTIAGGMITNLSVNDGVITIEGAGLNNVGNKAKIISRAIQINADIQAGEIEIISGRNDYNPQTGITTAKADDGSVKPAFAIDSSAIGGMYAGKIILKGTENGVGFRLSGDMAASTSDLVITNDGKIEFKNAVAENNINVATTGAHDIDLDGVVTSKGNTVLTSSNDINISSNTTIESKGANTQLKADSIITNTQGAVIGYLDMTISASQLINDTGTIIAGNDLTIGGTLAGTAMTTLDNLGGSIESINGNISIKADMLNNVGNTQVESTSATYWFRFRQSIVPGWLPKLPDLSPAGYSQMWDGNNTYVITAHPEQIQSIVEASGGSLADYLNASNGQYYFQTADWLALAPSNATQFSDQREIWGLYSPDEAQNAPSSGYMGSEVITENVVAGTYAPSSISSQSGDITLDIGTQITNDKSHISAANDLTITGAGSLDDISTTLYKRIIQRTSYGNGTTMRETGWGKGMSGYSYRQNSSEVVDTVASTYAAGNDNNITLGGDVVSVSTPGSNLVDFDFGGISSGNIRTTLQTGNTESQIFVNSGLVQPASDTNFKYKTRFSFANLGNFYGSDYFLSNILPGYDPDLIPQRLGDAYIDSKIINEQVLSETGLKFLDQGYGSDTDQVKDLLDRGVAAKTALNLTPFIALTIEQQNTLTQDIVWYEQREVDGETLLVPQLYLAKATLDETGTKLRGSTISGRNVNIDATNVALDMGRVTADETVTIKASEDVTVISGVIDANIIDIDAGDNFTLATGTTQTGNGITEIGTVQDLKGQIHSKSDTTINAGETASIVGADVETGGNFFTKAKNIVVSSLGLNSYWHRENVEYDVTSQSVSQTASTIKSGGDITLQADQNIAVVGSDLEAEGNITLDATLGNVTIETAKNISNSTAIKRGKSQGTTERTTHRASTLKTNNGDINITSGLGDVTLRAAEIDSGNDINIAANNGKVEILTAKDRDFHQHVRSKSNAVWQSSADTGYEYETIRHTILTGEGTLNITAANGITVEYAHTGNLDDDIAQLSQAPELAWMADLKNDPNVDWKSVNAIYRDWHEEQEGLSGPAAAVIAIAIMIATQGMGAGFVGLSATSTAGVATSAGFSALVAQATISAISNKGDLGAVFKELASVETVRSVAAAALTAGILKTAGLSNLNTSEGFFAPEAVLGNIQDQLLAAGVRSGVDVAINGADLSESLKSNLRFAGAAVLGAQLSQEIGIEFAKGEIDRGTQLIAHAVLGCAVGTVGTGNCGAGAAGQLAGEISGLLYGGVTQTDIDNQTQEWRNRGVNIARLSGAIAAALAGGNANDVNLGSDAGGTAAANNALCGGLCLAAAAAIIKCGANKLCRTAVIQGGKKVVQKIASKLGKKIDVDDLQSLKGAKFKDVEKAADKKFLSQGWTKTPLKKGDGWRYTDGKGGSFQLNRGYKGSDNVHGGPYIKTTVGNKKVRIPLEGNPN